MKWDRVKLAKRHLSRLSVEELDSMKHWIMCRKSEILVLKYADARILEWAKISPVLPVHSKKTITFRRVDIISTKAPRLPKKCLLHGSQCKKFPCQHVGKKMCQRRKHGRR